MAGPRRGAGARRAGRRRVPAHPGGQRVRVRARARPGGSSSTTRCCARRRRARCAVGRRARAGPRQGPATWSTGTLIGALGAAAGGRARSTCSARGSGLLRLAGVDSIGEPRRVGLLLAVVTVAGLVAGPVTGARVPAHRGPRRRARAAADRRPRRRSRRCSAALAGQPRRSRPTPLGVPAVRHPPRHRGAHGRSAGAVAQSVTCRCVVGRITAQMPSSDPWPPDPHQPMRLVM